MAIERRRNTLHPAMEQKKTCAAIFTQIQALQPMPMGKIFHHHRQQNNIPKRQNGTDLHMPSQKKTFPLRIWIE